MEKTASTPLMTPERQKRALDAKRERNARIKQYGFLAPLKAIRAKCLDCQGEGESWVRNCDLHDCPLWPYRMGRKPTERDLLVAQISVVGEVDGHKHLSEVRAGQALEGREAAERQGPWHDLPPIGGRLSSGSPGGDGMTESQCSSNVH